MILLDSSRVSGGGSQRLAEHDKILVVDFGSQVTQLIARRVREEKGYCEIVPFQRAEEGFPAMRPKGGVLSRGPGSGLGARCGRTACSARDLCGGRAGPRHLLRRAGDGPATRRQGRGGPPS